MKKTMTTLLDEWPGIWAAPPWDAIAPTQFVPAFEQAIELAESELDAIASHSEPPTFDNTLVAMEQTGQALQRVQALFWVHAANLNLGPIPELQKQVMPLLAAHQDRVFQNAKLFERIEAIYRSQQQGKESLDEAQVRLLDEQYSEFVRYGAKLDASSKERVTQINQQLASQFADFSQHVLDDEQDYRTDISDESRLAGLPQELRDALRQAAKEQGNSSGWTVQNTRSVVDPFLTYADDRELRKEVWSKFYARGDNGDANDNNAIIQKIVALRAERAQLLGYPSHAHWALERSMAKTPEAAMDLMMSIWPKAVARVHEEVAEMQAVADHLGHDIQIEPWDYRFYAEKVRKAKYDLDFSEVKPYLQLEKLVEAMFWSAEQLFGISFQAQEQIPVFHPDVRVWEVSDAAGVVGLFYLDPYAREGKRSGAWMTDYRSQSNLNGPVLPLISNNSNFIAAAGEAPTLISWDDAETLFHEFGHGLHGLLSKVVYPSQSGTSVARDYVEFPSQIFEHWLSCPEVLTKFCVHWETGEPLPAVLVEKIQNAATFNQGYATVEFLSSAILDMKLHLLNAKDFDPKTFETSSLAELEMPPQMVMRHRLPHFLHLFSDDGYSAAYYSYLWADALTADAASAFREAGSFFDPALAERLHDKVLSVGNTIDPEIGYREFRGRDVDPSALLLERGFPVD